MNLPSKFSVEIRPDKDGFTGRECPKCKGYFKIKFGTGPTDARLKCRCPYCGYAGGQDGFNTKEQIKYATSIAMRKVSNALDKELDKEFKKMGFRDGTK